MKKRTCAYIALICVLSIASLSVGWGEKGRTITDYLKIGNVGGSIILNASGQNVTNLMQIAAVCKDGGAKLHLKNCSAFETHDLMKISIAGGGGNGDSSCVTFEF